MEGFRAYIISSVSDSESVGSNHFDAIRIRSEEGPRDYYHPFPLSPSHNIHLLPFLGHDDHGGRGAELGAARTTRHLEQLALVVLPPSALDRKLNYEKSSSICIKGYVYSNEIKSLIAIVYGQWGTKITYAHQKVCRN